jgi:hypothetical protein
VASAQFTTSGTWTATITGTVTAQGNAPGGSGGGAISAGAGSGAGGGENGQDTFAVTLGNPYAVTIGAPGTGAGGTGSNGGNVQFGPDDNGKVLLLHGGTGGGGNGAGPGAGGTGSTNAIHFDGGAGAPHGASTGGGGGGGGGTASAGNAGAGAVGGTAVTGGGPGGSGGGISANGQPPASNYGGGGGGAGKPSSATRTGGSGAPGQITLTWTPVTTVTGGAALSGTGSLTPAGSIEGAAALTGAGTLAAAGQSGGAIGLAGTGSGTLSAAPQVIQHAAAALSGHGTLTMISGAPAIVVANQWASSEAQNPQFGASLPAGSSVVVPLTPAFSVGGGSGTPTPGNWLIAFPGWHSGPDNTVTVAVGDDTPGWWRPFQPSAPGITRTACWYQPNILAPTEVFCAPSGYVAGMSVLVVEIAGPGPWDTVTGTALNYGAAVTSLALSLGAPAAQSFTLAAVTGSSAAAGTAIAGTGWAPLSTVTASNGSDLTGDAVLAAAFDPLVSGSTSVTGTAGSSEALSGFIIGFLAEGDSPVPPGINPNWPYTVTEAAFGSGYQTPPDQMTWTPLQTAAAGYRMRKWKDTTGIQYELDALAASESSILWDNPDANLSPFTPASPYFPHVVPGVPVRVRAVPPATTGADRWYVLGRNMERWPQSWDGLYRGQVQGVGSDIWSVAARKLPTCYRAEVESDLARSGGGWWWPCDDPAVIPTPVALVNAAPGNSAKLQIIASPNGLTQVVTGYPFASGFAYSAVQNFAAESGWMYGDPAAAAWQQTGTGSTGFGRYLSCNDPAFPSLAGGVTIEGWWNLAFRDTGGSGQQATGPYTQPNAALVLWEIASGTAPLASLQVTSGGALQLVTWSGSTPTTHAIWAGDARDTTWRGVTIVLTQTSWQAWVNGGVTATASGTASMSASWSWFLAGAGTGNSAAPPTSGTIAGCVNAAHSHLAVYPAALPAARVMAHYMAAYTAFGQLPAPPISAQFVQNSGAAGHISGQPAQYGPDGGIYTGDAFGPPSAGSHQNTLAAVACATGGGLTSEPSAPEVINVVPTGLTVSGFEWLIAAAPASPALTWFTSGGAGQEQQASTTPANYLYVPSYGSGASPPSAGSSLGDTAGQRIERLLAYGRLTTPARCIDPSPAPIVAALDIGGQACGTAVSNIASSDGGLLFVDTQGRLCYRSREWLAARTVAWQLGEDFIPYEGDITFDTDPQQAKNDIAVTQVNVAPGAASSGGGAGSDEFTSGLTFGPDASRQAAMIASQIQNGPQPYAVSSYQQATSTSQNQANWLADTFGTPQRRITSLNVNAMPKTRSAPLAWLFVLSVNVGDIVFVTRRPPGQPSFSGSYVVSRVKREIDFGAGVASAEIAADVLPSYYFSD